MPKDKLQIVADKVKVNGPQMDGGYTITFYVGEYEQDKVAELMKLPQGEVIELEINNNKETVNGQPTSK